MKSPWTVRILILILTITITKIHSQPSGTTESSSTPPVTSLEPISTSSEPISTSNNQTNATTAVPSTSIPITETTSTTTPPSTSLTSTAKSEITQTSTYSTSSSVTANGTTANPYTLPAGVTDGATNITCQHTYIYAKINETVNITCTIYINKLYLEWTEWVLEAYYKHTEFRPNKSEIEAARISSLGKYESDINSYPARLELIFSIIKTKGETWINAPDRTSKYILNVRNEANTFNLTVKSVSIEDHGMFDLILRDKRHLPVIKQNVSLIVYKSPETLDLTAPPVVSGSRYEATCTAAKFFPPGSLKLKWNVNGKPWTDYSKTDASLRSFWWLDYPDGANVVSTLTLWRAKSRLPAPKIECVATWELLDANKKCNVSVIPRKYHKPDISVTFQDGFAVCEVKCVPADVPVTWILNDDSGSSSMTGSTVTDRCKTDASLVNLRTRVSVIDGWANSKYTCRLKDYPPDGQPSEASRTYDTTPFSRGKPIIAIIVIVFGVALILGLIILTVALCFYKSSNGDKYRRF